MTGGISGQRLYGINLTPCQKVLKIDRPHAMKKIWLITKNKKKYYYDADAIKEPLAESSIPRLQQNIEKQIRNN